MANKSDEVSKGGSDVMSDPFAVCTEREACGRYSAKRMLGGEGA